jgi:CTP synthase
VLRSKTPFPDEARRKIALFTNVESEAVFSAYDADHVYAVPEMLEQQGIARWIERHLRLERVTPELRVWQEAVRSCGSRRSGCRSAWWASTSPCPTPTSA